METDRPITSPRGVIMVVSDPAGHVIAHAADFDLGRPAGFSLVDAQESRARQSLSFNLVRAYCSDAILPAFEPYDCQQILSKLERQHGFKVKVIHHGHGDEA